VLQCLVGADRAAEGDAVLRVLDGGRERHVGRPVRVGALEDERDLELAPDGDAELADQLSANLTVIDCGHCGGVLKPHVVFFGENVPRERVDLAMSWVLQSHALIIIGSSLAIFSGLRFVHAASKQGLPIAIVNLSETRGDGHANVLVRGLASDCVVAWRDGLLAPSA